LPDVSVAAECRLRLPDGLEAHAAMPVVHLTSSQAKQQFPVVIENSPDTILM